MPDEIGYVVLFVVGCLAGVLNVIAGGGSFLTLPILIFLGLPATVANGANRAGILLQTFQKMLASPMVTVGWRVSGTPPKPTDGARELSHAPCGGLGAWLLHRRPVRGIWPGGSGIPHPGRNNLRRARPGPRQCGQGAQRVGDVKRLARSFRMAREVPLRLGGDACGGQCLGRVSWSSADRIEGSYLGQGSCHGHHPGFRCEAVARHVNTIPSPQFVNFLKFP